MNLHSDKHTQELNNIFSYMMDVLTNEFPSRTYGVEYLMAAILDNPNSHAYMMLNACVMSTAISELRNIYIAWLTEHNKTNSYLSTPIEFGLDEAFQRVMTQMELEAINYKGEKIGSEHLLLALLNPITKCDKIIEVFKNMGIEYNFILSKFSEKKKTPSFNANLPKSNFNFVSSKIDNRKPTNSTSSESIRQYTININELAKQGKIDKLIGRERELNQIIKTLARKQKNNVVIVGKGGVGKSHLVKGLAQAIVNNNVPQILQGKEIVMLDVMALVGGTKFRGMFEERVKALFEDLKHAKNYILFIDDIQQVLRSQSKEKDTDLSQWINDILISGDVRVIATTNFKDYKNSIEINTSISRTLQKIVLEPNSIQESIDIIEQIKPSYEEYHNVEYTHDAIVKAVEWANRYIPDRSLPDSAIDIIDLSGANMCLNKVDSPHIKEQKNKLDDLKKEKQYSLNHGDFERINAINAIEKEIKLEIAEYNRSQEEDKDKNKQLIDTNIIAQSVSEMTNIPINKLSANEKEKIANIEEILKESIVGQDEAISSVCKIIKRNKVGLGNKNRVSGSILALGQTGTGKTLLAKQLAKELFGDENNMVRLDMSEFSEKNSVSKLIGAAPGYIGYENGGQLTEAIKNKQHCVILLDEIEKADKEIYNLFLQMFDEGKLTDSGGQIVNFKNVIVIMTSNVGAKEAQESNGGVGFATKDVATAKKEIVEKNLKRTFPPEFLNRIDQIVHFNPLNDDNLKAIIKLEIEKLNKRLHEQSLSLTYDEETIEYLLALAIKQKEYGARPIIRLIQDEIEDKITDLLLNNEYEKDYIFNIKVNDSKITID